VLEVNEIEVINNWCWSDFIASNGVFFNMDVILEGKMEKNILLDKYMKHTGNQGFIIDNLNVTNRELKDIVKQFDNEEEKNNGENGEEGNNNNNMENNDGYNNLQESNNYLSQIESSTVTKMKKDLEKIISNEEDFIRIKKFFLNYKLISTVLYLANDKQDVMELKRVVDIFEVLGENMLFDVDLFFITNLAKGLNAIDPDDKKYFSLNTFFNNLFQAHAIYFPDEEASQYMPSESNIIEQNYENNNMAIPNASAIGPIKDLYDDSEALTGNIKEDFVIKSLYPPKGKNSCEVSQRMNNDLVNIRNKNSEDLTFVNSTKDRTKQESTKIENEKKWKK
jgi:CRISPR/Cas system-associated endoribonuclease Cas2